jgi:hypothetical protein
MLGTNGGGFFNANSAHPYENPNALTNFLQMLAIFLIPPALCFAFGRAGRRHPPGLGRAGRDDGDVRDRRGLASPRPNKPATRCCRRWVWTRWPAPAGRRQHGRQGRALRHRRLQPVRGDHHRGLVRRGQRHARLASRRWAAWCRW